MGAGDSVRIETEAVLERHQTGSPKNVLTRVNYVHPSGHHLKASRGCSLAGALLMRRFDGSLKRFGRKIESRLRFLEVLRRTWPPMCR